MELVSIKKRISLEYSKEIVENLTDEKLLDDYKKTQSLKNEIDKLTEVLAKHKISDDLQKNIIDDYLPALVPAGVKGVIRGNKFNHIVRDYILSLKLPYEVAFEKHCEICPSSEKPDWYIRKNDKVIIGMNQVDLWKGGMQLNRGMKYIVNQKLEKNSKLVCVVCNYVLLKSAKTKVFTLFKTGFENDTLCYLNGLEKIITSYFSPEPDCKEPSALA
jgi:hypothetical protein